MTSEDLTDLNPSPPTFDVLPLSRELRQAIDELGYTHPTPVQREVFEPASRGRDLVVQARTGTGKTAAFGMPVVDALVQRSLAAVQVLTLCPTRELALQVNREIESLSRYRGIRTAAVYGGAPMGRQIEELSSGAQVLSGTPGRVLDHLRRGSLDPKSIRVFILDESDEMLSMGFLPQINEILGHLPAQHQTLLFSATLPPDIQRLAETKLKDPLFLTLSGDQIGALDIQHLVYMTPGDKLKAFAQVIEVENPESAIVFCNTRDETKRVAAALDQLGYAADWLNADLAQNERESVMAATRRGDLRFLVCTDVASRGIDISHLTHVINYDLPESPESYVHRTGRTGRAGRTGTAISLIEPSDIGNLYMLRLVYKIFPIEKQLPSAGELKTRQELDVVEVFAQAFANRRIHPDDLSLARRLLTHEAAERIVAGLLRDHLGARPDLVREAADARRAKVVAVEPVARVGTTANKPEAPDASAPVPTPQRAENERPRERRESRNEQSRDQARNELSRNEQSRNEQSRNEQSRDQARNEQSRNEQSRNEQSRNEQSRNEQSRATRERRTDRGERRGSEPRNARPRDEARQDRQDRRPERGALNAGATRTYRDDDFEFGYTVSHIPDEEQKSFPADVVSSPIASETTNRTDDSAELFVNVGRTDGAQPEEFLKLLDEAGVRRTDATRISIRRTHSFVRVPSEDGARAQSALSGATIAGKVVSAEPARSSRP